MIDNSKHDSKKIQKTKKGGVAKIKVYTYFNSHPNSKGTYIAKNYAFVILHTSKQYFPKFWEELLRILSTLGK